MMQSEPQIVSIIRQSEADQVASDLEMELEVGHVSSSLFDKTDHLFSLAK
ncbi:MULTISPECIES: hypothetical protein [Nitrosomonas]|uniref:Uncharacterized protein n=1 Tax=Nitrosomonas communis TaxID=44574 RepID=A0A5D3YCQ6_9PROT|nr:MULTISPECIES: hypothetical protein [Nitrosomonas]TYP87045.1 hypothetical protein BCL69_102714 [Nitrosomonas communis]UVS63282.1 hypothetical protein NX761_09420 [Nitrosomonas sp. PLL12]